LPVKVSIIIPAFNEERLLGQSLAQVNLARKSIENRGWTSELIVCDNNSRDRTAEIAQANGATVVFEPVNQIGRARNCGAAAATGDWLLFIDADSQPTPELFADVMEQIGVGECLAGGSTLRLAGNHWIANFVTGAWNWASRWRGLLAGSFIFCETAAFRKIGGFSPEFFTGEELDLARRLTALAKETGRKIVILHRHPMLTSDRKVRLYSTWENLSFMLKAGLRPARVMRDKAACYAWYDGRR
jgi:cellulose synthase/poly-beta-1,6-N-acetylglucosamine synthase-like glycosyltransferase